MSNDLRSWFVTSQTESFDRMPPTFRASKRPRFESDDIARLTWESKWANDRIEHIAQELRDVNARYAELRSVVQGMESHIGQHLVSCGSRGVMELTQVRQGSHEPAS
ncbi:hypothetical protein E3N88_40316 [Mikania micrantha]|uniref:Uncharacterized protein n=1 Tax=Mikania micrantha TaxID=192012 RepID=A0A5N6LMC8_9ASTR|nr:hypothetical protein E3N88_40316 [Mikania micrantha]